MEFKNPTPVAVCLIPVQVHKDLALMLIRRNNAPAKGLPAFPGGYVEEGETAQAAAARELLEETGFSSTADQWTLMDSKTNSKNRMLLFCMYHRVLSYAEYIGLANAGLHNPEEVAGFGLVTEALTKLPNFLGFPLHMAAACEFFQRRHRAQERAQAAAASVLERLADRGDIDEQTKVEMLTEVAQLIGNRI